MNTNTLEIERNRDRALYSAVTDKFQLKYPKDFYKKCLVFMQLNKGEKSEKYKFSNKDIIVFKKRFGNAETFKKIGKEFGESTATASNRVHRCLKRLRRRIEEISNYNIEVQQQLSFDDTKETRNDGFEEGFWNCEKISDMHYNHLVNAMEYAIQTNQLDKVAELQTEIRKREGFQDKENKKSLLDYIKEYSQVKTDIKRLRKREVELEEFFKCYEKKGCDDLSIK